jgi:hypothetical protein
MIVPSQTFDPKSPVSVYRAVRRQIGLPELKKSVIAPSQFVAMILGSSKK